MVAGAVGLAVPAEAAPASGLDFQPQTTAADQGAPDYYDSGLAQTPYMGWNNYFGMPTVTEAGVKGVADYLVSSGLAKAGYKYVWIDGGWNAKVPRDAQGNLVPDPERFPSGMDALVTYIHDRGLLAGIYTDAGPSDGKNCAAGSQGYYEQDTKRFASWKFDAVKVDFLCGIANNLDPKTAYTEFSAALQKAGRKMILNICNPVTDDWGVPHTPSQTAGVSYTFGPLVADSWRTNTDVAFGTPYEGIYKDMLRNADVNAAHPEANGPGHWNDPDFLIPMRKTEQGTLEMNEEESTTQFVLWAEMASPLVIGSDPRTLPQSMIDTLKNPEIIAVDQDKLGIQGVRVATTGSTDTYSKRLAQDGDRAVVLLNRGDAATPMTLNFADAGLTGKVSIRDLRARADRGTATGSYTVTVPAHGTAMLRLHGTDLVPGTSVANGATASPAVVRTGGKTVTFTRGPLGVLQVQGLDGGPVIGGPFLGQPAANAGADGRVDVYVRGLDNAVWQRTYDGKHWGGWRRLGGNLTDSPSVTADGTLYTRGADGKVWIRTTDGRWSSLGSPNDTQIYGRPGAATSTAGTTVAVRTPDDGVWVRTQGTDGTWSDWTAIGGTISSSPTLVAQGDKVSVFALASDYTLWQNDRTGTAFSGWFKQPKYPSGSVVGTLGGAADANGVWLGVRGPDDHVRVDKL
ncbi:glycoside hydrolase family 27 protein [Amycolatopsis sp. FDAARGOS 1241]|uniref:glycoside hydrolase family 27 protein n=1 Tax=Amycolatopsis sp. FDAARGOS 1241 TaxID=2778070 RepID=UPI0019521429|nr:glycoside hydrolase family 27 protein [Amycolatopsis sp. FDAARGOS 1241]QRP46310.1 glycoside hydrolase family 27 protein [Amycolatopsis sp. FDAARGOS 1241]